MKDTSNTTSLQRKYAYAKQKEKLVFCVSEDSLINLYLWLTKTTLFVDFID